MKNHRKKKNSNHPQIREPLPHTLSAWANPDSTLSDPIGFPNWSLLNFGKTLREWPHLLQGCKRCWVLKEVNSPNFSGKRNWSTVITTPTERALLWYTGAEREAVGAPPSRSQNCCPDPSNKTCDGVELFFLFFHVPRKHIYRYRHIFPFPSKHNRKLPVNRPNRRIFQKFIPPKKNSPKNGGTSSSSRASPHCADEVGVFIYPSESFSQMLHLKMAPKKNRRFLPLEICRLKNFQGPFVQNLGWSMISWRAFQADFCWGQSCLASGFFLWFGIDRFLLWFGNWWVSGSNPSFSRLTTVSFFLKKKQRKNLLVGGGWTNPFEKCAEVKLDHETPIFRRENSKNVWNRHRLGIYESMNLS